MIRQTRNYLVGALSGVTLIGIAIGAFVVIVSAQVFHEWPIAETGAGAAKTSVAPAKALGSPAPAAATATTGVDPALRAKGRANPKAATSPAGGTTGDRSAATDVSGPADAVESTPGTSAGGGRPSSSGGDSGVSSPRSSSSSPSSSGGGSPSGSSGNGSGDNNTASAASTGSGGGSNGSSGSSAGTPGSGGGSTGSSGGGGTTVETPVTAATVPPVSETVNETVHGADEAALGGTLEKTGVSETTESVVEGVAGPETPVGKTVDGTVEAVGGLVGGKSSSGE